MNKIALSLGVLVLALTSQQGFARNCTYVEGEDRWTIKTSVPNGAFGGGVQEISLESLMDSANPQLSKNQKAAIAERRWSGRLTVSDKAGDDVALREGDMISVEGFLYHAGCHKDGDYHLEIGTIDSKGSPHCWIVESPDPDQAQDAALKEHLVQVRQTLDTIPNIFTGQTNVPVKVTGQLFLDSFHIGRGDPGGGRGTRKCATNIWEIHPVTAIEVRSQ
jgi:hypothetical protein